MATFLGLFTFDEPVRGGRVLARVVASPGHTSLDRVRLARSVPHLLRPEPGAVGAADGEDHGGVEFPHLDGHRCSPRSRLASGSTGLTLIPR